MRKKLSPFHIGNLQPSSHLFFSLFWGDCSKDDVTVPPSLGHNNGFFSLTQDCSFSYHFSNDFSKCNASELLNRLNMYTPSRYFSGHGQDGGWYWGLARESAINLAPLPWEQCGAAIITIFFSKLVLL